MFQASVLCSCLFLSLLAQACGRDDDSREAQPETLVAADPSSTLSTQCIKPVMAKLGRVSYCKLKPDGQLIRVEVKASDYVQDPSTCEVTAPHDGMRATMVEMGFSPC